MSERTSARRFWEKAIAANWSIEDVQTQVLREAGVTPAGPDFRFEDGSRLKLMSLENPPRYAPDDEWVGRREARRATAVEIAQQKAAGG